MESPLSVLIVEDSDDDAQLMVRALRRSGCDVAFERVDTAEALAGALARRAWDVVLSDYSMPSLTGGKALAIVRESGQRCPFIIVSGAVGEEAVVDLMRSGAHDCIMKDKLSRLAPAVERELGEARMRREREEALASLRRELTVNAALAELAKNLIALPEDITAIATLVQNYAKELTGSPHGYVAVIDERSGALLPISFTDMRRGECAIRDRGERPAFPRNPDGTWGGLWGHSLCTKRAFFDNAPQAHPAAKGVPHGHIPVGRFLSAPVLSGEELVGQISVANAGRDYAPQDLTVIGRLADLFSIAVANHRTHLEKEQLSRQVRRMQKIEAIGTLAEGIAHDFNNILTPMTGYAELVQMGLARNSKMWVHQEQVLKACVRAKELVEQVLSLSRRAEEERRPVAPGPIVQEALRLLCSSLPSTITIQQHVDADCGHVLAVPAQIHQVVMNLCTNAYHAMRERGGILGVGLTRVRIGLPDASAARKPGDYIRLDVSDTGHGMDRETIEKIFDPYFTTKGKGEGTGLGLSIVESIVRKHGGSIGVYSEPGLGTTFHIYLPAEAGEIRAAEAESAVSETIAGAERILFVDDVPEIADMAKEMLQGLGYEVTAFTSSADALRVFSEDPARFDIVITDLTMPELTGTELAERMQKIRNDLPIILCSGLAESFATRGDGHPRIGKFLKKPILLHEYGRALRQVLDSSSRS